MNIFIRLFLRHKFFFLLVCAMGMNGYLLWSYPNIGGDAIAFLLPIHHLIAGDGYSLGSEPSLLFSPGYGLLAAPIYFFIRDIEYSGMLVSGFSYIGLVCVTYICISKILDKRAALISSLFITFSPLLISRSYINLADIAATFFIVLSVLLTVRVIVINTSRKVYFVIGLLFGFGTLIRPDCLLVAVGCAGVVIIIYLIDIMKQERGSVSLWSIVLSIVGFFFCVFPYMLYLHTHTGIWTISTKLSLLAVGGSGVHDVAIDASFFDTLMNTVKYDLVGTFDRMYTSGKFCLYSFVVCNFYMIVPVLFIWLSHPFFAFQGLGRSVFSKTDTMRGAAIFAVSFIPLIPYLLYAKADRRWLPYWTLFEIAAGIFVYFLLRGMIKDENNKTWLVTITIIGFSVIVSPFLPLPPLCSHILCKARRIIQGGMTGYGEPGSG